MKLTTRGFTLIELLVVVLIIGILTAVALPQYNKAILKSRMASLKPLVDSLAKAQSVYMLEAGQYASKIEELSIDIGGTPNETDTLRTFDWGKCAIVGGTPFCVHTASSIGYSYSLDTKKEYCLSKDSSTTSPQAVFCKNTTGKTSPDGSATVCGGDYYLWAY